MDKDRIKGKAKDIAGRVERQAGEWTGSEEHQAKGAAEQLKGKAQNVVGRMKDAGRDVVRDAEQREGEKSSEEERIERPPKRRAA